MDPIILFFLFGLIAGLLGCQLKFNASVSELLTTILLLSIGIKGGTQLNNYDFFELLPIILIVGSLGLAIPLLVFPIVYKIGKISRIDSAVMAAHYGSVSVGTFAVCIAYLKTNNISFESYVPLFVVVLEVPAILVGLIIAKKKSQSAGVFNLINESLKSRGVTLLLGGLIVGWLAGAVRLAPYDLLFSKLFYGVLALFIIDMGFTVSEKWLSLKSHGIFILLFGIFMPLLSGAVAMAAGLALGLSQGGTVVLTLLGASSSYIAVPAAVRVSLPQANLGLSLGSSLGVTFPFNIIIGIPLFYHLSNIIYAI